MRPFGSLIDNAVRFRAPHIPDRRLERANPPAINHLDEGVRELFNYACAASDLEAAADLLALMKKWHAQRSYDDEQQRRTGAVHLLRMEGELKRRHIMKGSHP